MDPSDESSLPTTPNSPLPMLFRSMDGTGGDSPATTDSADDTDNTTSTTDTDRDKDASAGLAEVLDRITDGFWAVDTEWRFTYLNDRAEELINPDDEDLIGETVWDAFPAALESDFEDKYRHAMENQVPVSFEEHYPEPLDTWFSVDVYPTETGLSVYFQDISEEKRHEDYLQRSADAKHRLHEIAVSQAPLDEKLETVLEIGTDYFDLQYGFLADVDIEADPCKPCTFEVIAAHGFDPSDGWTYPVDSTYCQAVLDLDGVLWTTDAENADWVSEDIYDHFGFDTYIGAPVTVNGDRFGVVGFVATSARPQPFSAAEEAFIELTAQWIGYELSQATQSQRVATINECYEIARDIAHYILDTNDRDAVEAAVCDRLINNDLPFEMAWIGDVDYQQGELIATYQAGDSDDYLEAVTIPLDQKPPDPGTASPAFRAVRSHAPQAVSDTETDETIEPWREALLDRGYRSAIAVPLIHNEFLYGLLAIYSPEPEAFDGDVSEILGHLGALVGHTIHSIEQDKALSEDATVVELTYYNDLTGIAPAGGLPIDDLTGRCDADANSDSDADHDQNNDQDQDQDLHVTIERVVTHGDDRHILIRADGVVPEVFTDVLTTLPTVETVELVRCGNDCADEREPGEPCHDCVFAVAVTTDSLVSRIERHGARATDLAFAADGLTLTVEAPPTLDIAAFTAEVNEVYPGTDLVSKTVTEREWFSPAELDQIIQGELTPRQRDVLQTAHLAGYFEDPRENSGVEVAEILGISGATFSQHLRTAQNKLFSAIF